MRYSASGRRGSGSFGSDRTAGYAIGEGRTSPWLEAIAGIRSDHIPAGEDDQEGSDAEGSDAEGSIADAGPSSAAEEWGVLEVTRK